MKRLRLLLLEELIDKGGQEFALGNLPVKFKAKYSIKLELPGKLSEQMKVFTDIIHLADNPEKKIKDPWIYFNKIATDKDVNKSVLNNQNIIATKTTAISTNSVPTPSTTFTPIPTPGKLENNKEQQDISLRI